MNIVAMVLIGGLALMCVYFVGGFWQSAILFVVLALAAKLLLAELTHTPIPLDALGFEAGFQTLLALFYFFILSGTKESPLLFFPCLLAGAWVLSLAF